MIRLIGVGLLSAVGSVILREYGGRFSSLTALTGFFLLLAFALGRLSDAVGVFRSLSDLAGASEYAGTLLKVMATGYLTDLGGEICRELGAPLPASGIEMAGRVEILLLCLPDFLLLVRSAVALAGG